MGIMLMATIKERILAMRKTKMQQALIESVPKTKFKVGDVIRGLQAGATPLEVVDITDKYYVLKYVYSRNNMIVAREIDVVEAKNEIYDEKKDSKRWRAVAGRGYWRVMGDGELDSYDEYGSAADDFNYATGNYFHSDSEAEEYKLLMIARQTVIDDAHGFKPNWDDGKDKWSIIRKTHPNRPEGLDLAIVHHKWTVNANTVYFETEEEAENSLIEHEWEWRLIYGI